MFRFYFELFLRTLSASSFIHLINDPNFVLDIISILPTMLSQIISRFYISRENEETQLFDYLTCLKLFRLFRLTRHAKCLEILIKIFYINLKDILRLSILIIFGIFYFGLTQFVLEQIYQENEIKNIGEALWHVNIPFRILFDQKIRYFFSGIYSYYNNWLFRYCRTSIFILYICYCWCLVWSNFNGDYFTEYYSIISDFSEL